MANNQRRLPFNCHHSISRHSYINCYTSEKVIEWTKELELLASFGKTQPHAAYSSLTHGATPKSAYLSRTTPNIGPMLQPLETIRSILIPTLTNRPPPNDYERELFALPARHGRSREENEASLKITSPLLEAILNQNPTYSCDIMSKQAKEKLMFRIVRSWKNEPRFSKRPCPAPLHRRRGRLAGSPPYL